MQGVSGKKLNDVYFKAWRSGMKGTYYIRSMGASQIEKSTLDAKQLGFTQKRAYQGKPVQASKNEEAAALQVCSIDNPECEACE